MDGFQIRTDLGIVFLVKILHGLQLNDKLIFDKQVQTMGADTCRPYTATRFLFSASNRIPCLSNSIAIARR